LAGGFDDICNCATVVVPSTYLYIGYFKCILHLSVMPRNTFLDPIRTILYIAVIVYEYYLSCIIFKPQLEGDQCPTKLEE